MLTEILGKARVTAVVLAGFLLIGSVTPASAYANCEQRIRKAERNLDRAVARHGLHSVQAERRRDQLERVRARCHR